MTGKDDHLMVELSVLGGRKINLKGVVTTPPFGRQGLNTSSELTTQKIVHIIQVKTPPQCAAIIFTVTQFLMHVDPGSGKSTLLFTLNY